jgi:hypothetical protein
MGKGKEIVSFLFNETDCSGTRNEWRGIRWLFFAPDEALRTDGG